MSSSLRIVNDQSAADSSVIGPNRIAEGLLTRTPPPPYAAAASVTQAFAPTSDDRSTGAIAVISPPASRTRRTVSAEASGFRSQPTTAAPSPARISGVARPIPPAVPVTRATLPASRGPVGPPRASISAHHLDIRLVERNFIDREYCPVRPW